MDLGLRGKKAILSSVDGATGRAIAELLAREGADIGFSGRPADLQSAATALKSQGIAALGAELDLRDGDKYRAGLEQLVKDLGGCDIFIVNAGMDARSGQDHSWNADFEADVLNTVRACDTLAPHLKAAGGGAIVILGASATSGDPALTAYAAMQAGLVTYSKQLSQFLGKDETRVNYVAPSPGTGTAEEVARTVVFLASPAASVVTGANIVPGVKR